MKLITEYFDEDTRAITEEINGQKQLYIEGTFAQAEVPNRNRRQYPVSVLEREIDKYNTNYVMKGRALGELNHPQRPNVDPREASHRIVEMRREGNNFYGKALILDTPVGDIARGLIKGGTNLGVSTRGLGTLKEMTSGISEVQSDFRLTTVDIVSDPSGPDCFVNGIMEGVDWIWDNTAFKPKQLELVKQHIEERAAVHQLDEELFLKVWTSLVSNIAKL